MKLAFLVSGLLFASQVYAQATEATGEAATVITTLETEAPVVTVSKGVRVSLIKPVLVQRISTSAPRTEGTKTTTFSDQQSFGLGLGWGDIPVRDMGGTLGISYIDFGDTDTRDIANGLAKIDANLAYGFSSKLSAKGGFNVSRYTQGDIGRRMLPGTGVQAGFGYQIIKNLGIDATYLFTSTGGNNKGGRTTATISGLEVAVTGTF